jgi:hypothetical protein
LPYGAEDFEAGGRLPNHLVAAPLSLPHDQVINQRIPQAAVHDMDRKAVAGVGMGKQFPVAEVASQTQRTGMLELGHQPLPLSEVGEAYTLADVVLGQGRQKAKFRGESAEVEQTLTQDRAALSLAFARKGQRQVEQTDPAMEPVEHIEEPSHPFADPEGQAKGEETQKRDEGEKEHVLETCNAPAFFARWANDLFLPNLGTGRKEGLRSGPAQG